MEKIQEWLKETMNDRKSLLFWLTALATIAFFALILLRAFMGIASIPQEGITIYLALLGTYVTINVGMKVVGQDTKSQRGEYFFAAWIVLYIALFVLTGLNKVRVDVLPEIKITEYTVIGLFFGTEGIKKVKEILGFIKNGNNKKAE